MKSALKMSVKDDAQTREEIARLTVDELRALTKDAFFWGMHPSPAGSIRDRPGFAPGPTNTENRATRVARFVRPRCPIFRQTFRAV